MHVSKQSLERRVVDEYQPARRQGRQKATRTEARKQRDGSRRGGAKSGYLALVDGHYRPEATKQTHFAASGQ